MEQGLESDRRTGHDVLTLAALLKTYAAQAQLSSCLLPVARAAAQELAALGRLIDTLPGIIHAGLPAGAILEQLALASGRLLEEPSLSNGAKLPLMRLFCAAQAGARASSRPAQRDGHLMVDMQAP